jgi:hypothetical protein
MGLSTDRAYFANEEGDNLHDRLPVIHGVRVEYIEGERRHEESSVARGYLENSKAGLWACILRRYGVLARIGRQEGQSSQNLHCVNVMLPDLKSTRADVNGKHLM